MPLRPDMELQDYVKIFLVRKWVIICAYLLVGVMACIYYVYVPKKYLSSTTILALPPQVPEDFIPTTVTLGTGDRLATIQEQITSRTRLKKVMEEVGLYERARREGRADEAASSMAKRITVNIASNTRRGSGRDASDAFTISFLHKDPMMAKLTTSRIASLFIEENLKLREKQAVGTSEFIETQLKDTKAKLDAQEEKVKQYKLQYSGGLPEELRVNLDRMDRLNSRERMISDEIRFAEQRKLTFQAQLSNVKRGPRAILQDDGNVQIDTSEDAATVLERELSMKRAQLAALTAKFTDRYPDVIRMKGEVEELEQKLAAMPNSVSSSERTGANPQNSKAILPLSGRGMEEYGLLKSQISSTESEIASLKRERNSIKRDIAALQAKVGQGTRRDLELITLNRDYENLKAQYTELLKKKMEADLSHDMEMRMKGAQFELLDPANLPNKPFSPNIKKIGLLAFLMASFLGFGGAIGLEKMDLSLRGVTDFKYYFDVPILVSLPILETLEFDRQKKLRRKAIIGGIISFAFALVAFILFIVRK